MNGCVLTGREVTKRERSLVFDDNLLLLELRVDHDDLACGVFENHVEHIVDSGLGEVGESSEGVAFLDV